MDYPMFFSKKVFTNLWTFEFVCIFASALFDDMLVIFEKEYLRDLYLGNKPKDKKHRYQPQVVRKYIRTIDLMMAQENVLDLTRYGGLHYEKLTGDKAGFSSVRVNNQYRIEFREIIKENEVIAQVCSIVELSNHYE